MLEYFTLQRTLWERRFRDWQLAPWVVYTLGPVLFFVGGHLLLNRSALVSWLIVFFGLSTVQQLSDRARNDFLRGLYRGNDYRNIRLVENVAVLLPFLLLLTIEGTLRGSVACWAGALVLWVVGMSMAWWTNRPRFARALPTPFSRRPFEFAAGFRRYWWVLLIAVFLLVQGIRVGNFELGVFAAGIAALTGCQAVARPEPVFYVWIHTLSATAFLRRKMLTSTWHQLLLVSPFLLALGVAFPERWLVLLVVLALSVVYVLLWLLAKYACFPRELNVGHAFIIALGMVLPPALLIIIPMYYQRARTRVEIALP